MMERTGLAGRLVVEGEGEKGIKFKLQIFGWRHWVDGGAFCWDW